MMDNIRYPIKSRTSYADLLELYLQKPDDLQAIADTLGFKKSANNQQQINASDEYQPNTDANINQTDLSQRKQAETSPKDRPNLPFYYVAKRERFEHHINPQPPKQPKWYREAKTLDDDEIYDDQAKIPEWRTLTRTPKLWAKLRQILKQNYTTEEPDIPRLVQHIERGDSFKQFPYRQKKRRVSQLLVLADYADHLRTARQDYQQLHHELIRYWGKSNIHWQCVDDHPLGKVSIWKNNQHHQLKWQNPPLNTAVLILSDCASLGNKDQQQNWQQLLRELKQAGNIVMLLAPVAAHELHSKVKGIHVYSWDYHLQRSVGSYQQAMPTQDENDTTSDDVEKLLAALAFTYYIEPSLLRETRQLLGLNVSCEAKCRQHDDVIDDGKYLVIKLQAQKKYRDYFRLLKTKQQDSIIQIVKNHHAPLVRSILDFELDTVQALRPDKPVAGAKESRQRQQCLAKTFAENLDDPIFRSFVNNLLKEQESGGEVNALLFVLYHKEAIEAGDYADLQLPKNVSLQQISQFIDIRQAATPYSIHQHGKHLQLKNQETIEPLALGQFNLANTQSTKKIMLLQPQNTPIKDNEAVVMPLGNKQISIDTGSESITIASLSKPDWADNIGRDQQGLFLECEHVKQSVKVYYPQWGGKLKKDQYGIYIELNIKGITQRFRYIPAGVFLMGSPKNEIDRQTNERQHEVSLSQGYWLADTACTQELWQAVMGDNPASFKDNVQNPIEQVSWNDVQLFLNKLNTLIPQLNAELPTEAQWEYACRAGTSSPFSFGANITPEQVNYDGSYPYAKGKKGEDRNKTIEVKALTENQWGLYQMHGNVWEWCQDWYGDYPAELVQDPQGKQQGEYRVLRGGSWINSGQYVRSAYRYWSTPGNRYSDFGFRFSLGQATGEAAAESNQVKKIVSDQSEVRAEPQRNVGSGLMAQGVDKLLGLVKRKK